MAFPKSGRPGFFDKYDISPISNRPAEPKSQPNVTENVSNRKTPWELSQTFKRVG